MATTEWKYRLFFFIRKVDVTLAAKRAFAKAFSDNQSWSTEANEMKMFDSPIKFYHKADATKAIVAYGINSPVKLAMRSALVNLLSLATNARYVVVTNTAFSNYKDGEHIANNFGVSVPAGRVVTWEQALTYLENEFGLVPYQAEPEL